MSEVMSIVDQRLREMGSTRPIALFRIAIASLAMMRFGPEMSLHLAESFPDILLRLAFFLFTTLAALGAWTRVSLTGLAAVLGHMYFVGGFIEDRAGWGHHHHYMLFASTVLLAMSPCGRSFSIDRAFAIRKAEGSEATLPLEVGPTWIQTLLVLQMAALYFWTAIDKTNAAFLRGDRLERIFEWVYAGTPLYDVLTQRWFLAGGSIFVVLIEYVLPFMLIFRWRLPWAYAIAFALHAGFYVMLPVQTYSATMLAMYILVAHPDSVHAALDRYVFGKTGHVQTA